MHVTAAYNMHSALQTHNKLTEHKREYTLELYSLQEMQQFSAAVLKHLMMTISSLNMQRTTDVNSN
jgi:hypothetical protein